MTFTKLFFFSICAGLVSSATAAVSVVFASDDNFVRVGEPTTVQDFTGSLLVKDNGNTNSFTRLAWIRFDLASSLADPSLSGTFNFTFASSQISGATADFSVFALKSGFTPSGSELGTGWAENAITFNNAPGRDEVISGTLVDFESIGSDTFNAASPDTIFSFSLPTMGDYIQGDNSVTLAIKVTSQSSIGAAFTIYSSETGTTTGLSPSAPNLVVSQIPEISFAFPLAGLIFAGFARRKRD